MIYLGLEAFTDSPPPTQPFVIKFDDENYPILPSWSDDEVRSLSDVRALLSNYFSELWSKYFTTRPF
jgi:hypothetical protein